MRLSCSAIGACLMVLCIAPIVGAAEKKISHASLPPAVQNTVHEQLKGGTIKGYSQETEHGQTTYEVEMIVNGHSKDLTIASDGEVLEAEEQVDLSALSENLQRALKAKAGKGQITKVESITKGGRLVAYEVQVRILGRHKEIQVAPDAQELSHEE